MLPLPPYLVLIFTHTCRSHFGFREALKNIDKTSRLLLWWLGLLVCESIGLWTARMFTWHFDIFPSCMVIAFKEFRLLLGLKVYIFGLICSSKRRWIRSNVDTKFNSLLKFKLVIFDHFEGQKSRLLEFFKVVLEMLRKY